MEAVLNNDTREVGAAASEWMTTNLPWLESFWQEMDAMRLMRLNPHWHIDEKDGGYAIDDIMTDFEFGTDAILENGPGRWSADFPSIGLTLLARKGPDGNAELAYEFTQQPGCRLDAAKAERLVRYWLPSLREYYRLHGEDSLKHRFWRFVMNRIMLKMNPTQRRICSFMLKLTVLETLLIVVLAIGFWFYVN
ncbi:hypothetical protein [Salidesulfovibrio onnuriiensis]|uniref:hypothetical protein n=1 Tax=Salidesulfovibrio onnuriiensis TaxID=2583823 RepID=UPI0011CA2FE4|nr:hypothetical protein [Salidesulfovibrio onnuriiensis]